VGFGLGRSPIARLRPAGIDLCKSSRAGNVCQWHKLHTKYLVDSEMESTTPHYCCRTHNRTKIKVIHRGLLSQKSSQLRTCDWWQILHSGGVYDDLCILAARW